MRSIPRGAAILAAAASAAITVAGCGGIAAHPGRSAARRPPAHRTVRVASAGVRVRSGPASAAAAGSGNAARAYRAPADTAPADTAPAGGPAAGYHGPHFRTPRAAMRFLAAAYNRHDTRALHAVTTPDSYRELTTMWSGAIDLRLRSCAPDRGHGDYTCYFIHNYPASAPRAGHETAVMLAAPARNPGWYLYAIATCG